MNILTEQNNTEGKETPIQYSIKLTKLSFLLCKVSLTIVSISKNQGTMPAKLYSLYWNVPHILIMFATKVLFVSGTTPSRSGWEWWKRTLLEIQT